MPAVIRGELTSVTVRFRHTEQKEAFASLQVTLTDGEIIAAKCRQENGRITGYIGCNREDTMQKLQEKEEDFDVVYKPNSSTSDLSECGSHVTAEDRYEIPGIVSSKL